MADTGEHRSDAETAMEPTRLDIDWLPQDDPVERFGTTVERAVRQLAVELAGLRAERDGLLLELEGVRAQYELARQQLAERDRFTATVRELGEIVRHLSLPPGWSGDPRIVAHLRAASAIPTTAEDPALPAAPIAPPADTPPPTPAPPVAPVYRPSTPLPPPADAAPAAPVVPEPAPAPPAPAEHAPTAPGPASAPVPAASEAVRITEPPAPAPAAAEEAPATVSSSDSEPVADEPSKQLERFFDGKGVWLDEPAAPARRQRLKSALRGVGFALVGLFVAVVLFVSVGPRFLPYQTYFVRSGSMEPTIETGSMIMLTKTDAEDLDVGDIISFKRPDRPDTIVTHRIHAIEESDSGRVFVTKGDANGSPDVWRVPATGSGWRYAFGVPKVGYVLGYLGTPTARLALLAMPALLLGVLSLIDIWRPSASTRGDRTRRSKRSRSKR